MSDERERIGPTYGGQWNSGQCVNCLEPATGTVIVSEPSHGPNGRFRAWKTYPHCEGCGRNLEWLATQRGMRLEDVQPRYEETIHNPADNYIDAANPLRQQESDQRVRRVYDRGLDVEWCASPVSLEAVMARVEAQRRAEAKTKEADQARKEHRQTLEKLERTLAENERLRGRQPGASDDRIAKADEIDRQVEEAKKRTARERRDKDQGR